MHTNSALQNETSPLFKPFTAGSLSIPNRFVMAPMTRGASPGGVPGQNVVDYYRRRAEGHKYRLGAFEYAVAAYIQVRLSLGSCLKRALLGWLRGIRLSRN